VAALAVLHEARVGGDAVEPGGERGLDLEPLDPAVGREERVLERLGGVLLVTEDLVGEPIHLVLVAPDQLVEGAIVAALRVPNELLVVGRAVFDRLHAVTPLSVPARSLCSVSWVADSKTISPASTVA